MSRNVVVGDGVMLAMAALAAQFQMANLNVAKSDDSYFVAVDAGKYILSK